MQLPSLMPLLSHCLRVPLVLLTAALTHLSENCPKYGCANINSSLLNEAAQHHVYQSFLTCRTQLSLLSTEFYLTTLKDALDEARAAKVPTI